MSRILLACLFIVLVAENVLAQNDLFFEDWRAKDISIGNYIPIDMPASSHSAEVVVNLNVEGKKVSPQVYGTNSAIWASRLYDQSKLVGHLKDLNAHIIRFPGGSLSDTYFWDTSPDVRPSDIPSDMNFWGGQDTEDWTMALDDYYKLLDSANAQGSICINYGYARYGLSEKPVEQAAHHAAEWVRYDNGRTTYWELGNENFGDWEAGYKIDTDLNQDGQPKIISGALYGQHYKVFADSMKNAAAEFGHEIRLGAVAVESDAPWNNVAMNWNKGLMSESGDVIDYYVIHTYFTPYDEDSSPDVILKSPEKVAELKAYVLDDLAQAGKPVKPIVMTEWNIFAEGSWQQVSNINGLHGVLAVCEFIENDFGQALRWDIVNWWEDGNDHGMFSYGGEPGVPVWNPRPSFFYMYYLQKLFGDTMVETSVSGNSDIVSYASTFNSEEIGMAIVNRSSEDKVVNIKLSGYRPAEYMMFGLKGDMDNSPFSRKVIVNDKGTNFQGGGPENYAGIQPYGNVITENSLKVKVPGYGAIFTVVSKGEMITGLDENTQADFKIFPNPGNGKINIISFFEDMEKVQILDMSGRIVLDSQATGKTFTFNSNLSKGIYLLKLKTTSKAYTDRIIIK